MLEKSWPFFGANADDAIPPFAFDEIFGGVDEVTLAAVDVIENGEF